MRGHTREPTLNSTVRSQSSARLSSPSLALSLGMGPRAPRTSARARTHTGKTLTNGRGEKKCHFCSRSRRPPFPHKRTREGGLPGLLGRMAAMAARELFAKRDLQSGVQVAPAHTRLSRTHAHHTHTYARTHSHHTAHTHTHSLSLTTQHTHTRTHTHTHTHIHAIHARASLCAHRTYVHNVC
jgi:hypothetical protein